MDIEFVKSNKRKKTEYNIFDEFVHSKNPLLYQKTEDLINLFDAISKYWSSKECGVGDLIRKESMGFIIPWLKKRNTLTEQISIRDLKKFINNYNKKLIRYEEI